MLLYCLKYRKEQKVKKPPRIMLLSSRAVSDSKKSRFITDQEAKGLLSLICKVPVLGKLVI